MASSKNLLIITACALTYFLAFQLNTYLFSAFEYTQEVNWVFLPGGLRLILILLFVEWGAIGIGIASIAICYLNQIEINMITIIGTGFMSGFAPWLARLICIDRLKLDVNLKNLTPATLLKISAVFALLSPVLHQLWFTWRNQTADFVRSTSIMAVGDLVGTMIVLYGSKLVLNLLSPAISNRSS
jgi:hypothetical protein